MPDAAGFPWLTDVRGGPDMAGFHPKQPYNIRQQPDMAGFPTAPHVCLNGPSWTGTGEVVNTGGANSSRRVLSIPGVCIAYGSFSVDTTSIARTTNGRTWAQVNVGAGAQSWIGATYMPNYGDYGRIILLAGQGGAATNVYVYSDDLGVTWVAGTMPVTAQWIDLKYGDGVVIAIAGGGTASNVVYYTLDAINWTASALTVSKAWASIAYSPDLRLWLAIAGGSSTTNYSLNGGQTWEVGTVSPQNIAGIRTGYSSLIWATRSDGRGMFIYPVDGASAGGIMPYSVDGFNWLQTPRIVGLVGNASWGEVFCGDGIMITSAVGSDNIAISIDGVSWTNYPAKLLFGGNARHFGLVNPGQWVCINFSTTGAFYGVC